MSEREKPEQAAYDLGFEEGHRLGVEEGARQERERAIKAQDRCDALELELVDLRLDRQRLDWLDAYGWYHGAMGVGSARELIDATFAGPTRSELPHDSEKK